MSNHPSLAGADAAILGTIIDGGSWTAARVRNIYFRQHCRAFGRTFRDPLAVVAALRDPCKRLATVIASRSELLITPQVNAVGLVPAIVRKAAYSGEWQRCPESWNPHGETSLHALAQHLFALWPLPGFMVNAWSSPGGPKHRDRDWYCYLARGGSWKTAPGIPVSITRRALHLAGEAPSALTIPQALRFGQVRALSGSAALMEQVLASRMVGDLSNEAIWSRLLEKTAASREFNALDFGVIADVLLELLVHDHHRRASMLVELPLLELRSHAYRRWRDILKQVEAAGMHFRDRDLTRPGLRAELRLASTEWEPMPGVKPFDFQLPNLRAFPGAWTIRELCNNASLMVEGRELRHCVASYSRRCQRGEISIFSLCQSDPEGNDSGVRLTIEVNRHSRRIVQTRGRWNRQANRNEAKILTRWAAENQLIY